jgi:hypothetical protein
MSSKKSIEAQKICVDIVNEHPRHLIQNWGDLTRHYRQMTLLEMYKSNHEQFDAHLHMPRTINWKKMKQIYDIHPRNYEEFIAIKGVGPQTVRALALISELIYGEKPSWKDPVKFTFTVGGKDGIPYPVDTKTMDQTTDIIQQGIQQAKIGNNDKLKAIQRLHNLFSLSTRT